MKRGMIWGLLLGLAMVVAGGGLVLAQDTIIVGDRRSDSLVEDIELARFDFDELDACPSSSAFGAVTDVSARAEAEVTADSTVDVDEPDVLRGIALQNAGITDFDFNDLNEWTVTERESASERRDSEIDDDDVVAALALDLTGDASDALDCIADVDRSHERFTERRHSGELDDDGVVAAIAWTKTGGRTPSFRDIADISDSLESSLDVERNSDLDRDDALEAIALDP